MGTLPESVKPDWLSWGTLARVTVVTAKAIPPTAAASKARRRVAVNSAMVESS